MTAVAATFDAFLRQAYSGQGSPALVVACPVCGLNVWVGLQRHCREALELRDEHAVLEVMLA